MQQIDIREGALRQHRSLALFGVIQCWLRSLDGLVFDRPDLERVLGLERFKKERVRWLQEDFRDFFPHQQTFWSQNPESFGALYVCRVPFEKHLPAGTMTDKARIAGMKPGSPKLGLFEIWARPSKKETEAIFEGILPFFSDAANYDERLLSSYLALLCQGQISPKSLPPLKVGGKK